MRTQMMIGTLVGAVALAGLAIATGTIWWLGLLRGAVAIIGAIAVLAMVYRFVIKPWHIRWGATNEEVARTMPGDLLFPDARPATRAITIAAPPEAVWPWLVQIGYGKAGWYSYDWIDNDFQPSADRIIPEYQHLAVGDRILMTPTLGFVVRELSPGHSIVSTMEDEQVSWCLALYPTEPRSPGGERGTRLVSRWRPEFELTPSTLLLTVISEPGTFIMEQKMLRTIRDRAEGTERVRRPKWAFRGRTTGRVPAR